MPALAADGARRRSRARCAPCCRTRSSASRRSCCPPCRRSWPARWSKHRPGTRGPACAAAAFSASSTTPGCTMARGRRIDLQHAVQILGVVDDQRLAHGLAALRAAGAARQDRHAFLGRDGDRAPRAASSLRGTTTPIGCDLVDRGVGRIAPAARGVEQDFARRAPCAAASRERAARRRRADLDRGTRGRS